MPVDWPPATEAGREQVLTVAAQFDCVVGVPALYRRHQIPSSVEGTQKFVTVTNPQKALDELFNTSRQQQFEIQELTLKRATLEDVFLKLTGHQLRD